MSRYFENQGLAGCNQLLDAFGKLEEMIGVSCSFSNLPSNDRGEIGQPI